MRTRRQFGVTVLGVAALALLLTGAGRAKAQFSVTITADENGNARFTNTAGFNSPLAFQVGQDPGPGGRANALIYDLLNPPGLTQGDVFVRDPSGSLSDVLRFNATSFTGGTGELVFYSLPGGTDLADKAGFPSANYANTVTIQEAANGTITFTPTAGQPGFVTGAGGPVTYSLTSPEVAVPEPSSLALLAFGGAALAGWRRWRKRATKK